EIAAFKAWLGQRGDQPSARAKSSKEAPVCGGGADAAPAAAPPAPRPRVGAESTGGAPKAAGGLSRRARKRLREREQPKAAGEDEAVGGEERGEGGPHGATPSRRARRRLRQEGGVDDAAEPPATRPDAASSSAGMAARGALGKAAAKLQGSRFRWLNDTLYSITGDEAKRLYEKDPALASVYHEGFRLQASKWPKNPLDGIIRWLRDEVPAEMSIGDFGCGEARLALELKGRTVHSLDLVRINERVTPCNLAAVPLGDGSIDVAVFCLALMGTDWPSFLREAHRCLRPRGLLHIAEVESRMADFNKMIRQVEGIGFKKRFFKPGSFFVEMRFEKRSGGGAGRGGRPGKKGVGDGAALAGCTYRKR
ncbi:unnamed protein product, partial [Prorocentrum cordatum]